MREIRRFVLLGLALALLLAGWRFRHALVGWLGQTRLPSVQPAPAGTVRIALIGDYGSGDRRAAGVARMIESWKPDLVATLGDNDYSGSGSGSGLERVVGGGRFYGRYLREGRFFPIPGHRDWDHDALRPYLAYFTLPGNERYYDMVHGPVHLFMLDTDEREPDGTTETSLQAQWLKQALARSTASWKLVLAHHAPYTSHTVEDITRMRWPFKVWGANAVLSGYYHVYERLLVDGIPYFVNGAGGAWVSGFGATDPHSQFRYAEDNGAMLVDASATRIVFRFVSRRGQIVDELVLAKPSPK